MTITISPHSARGQNSSGLSGSVTGVAPFRSISLTSPIPCHSLGATNPNSPIAARPINAWASSGARYSLSPTDETAEVTSESVHYTVHIPPTPNHQPASASPSKPKRSYLSGTIFTGGFNSVTSGHVNESMDEDSAARKSTGMFCRMNGCDSKAMVSKMSCECGFPICKECYDDCGFPISKEINFLIPTLTERATYTK